MQTGLVTELQTFYLLFLTQLMLTASTKSFSSSVAFLIILFFSSCRLQCFTHTLWTQANTSLFTIFTFELQAMQSILLCLTEHFGTISPLSTSHCPPPTDPTDVVVVRLPEEEERARSFYVVLLLFLLLGAKDKLQ